MHDSILFLLLYVYRTKFDYLKKYITILPYIYCDKSQRTVCARKFKFFNTNVYTEFQLINSNCLIAIVDNSYIAL